MLRVVSDGGSLLNWQGFSHFQRSSGSAAWSESSRVVNNVWHFWSGIYTPSDARLKDEVQDLPSEECLDVLRQVSAKSYVRNDLRERTRRIGFVAQEAEQALGVRVLRAPTLLAQLQTGTLI